MVLYCIYMDIMNDLDHIHLLITEKLTGNILSEDELYLEECIRKDKNVELLWNTLQQKWLAINGDDHLESIDVASRLEEVNKKITEAKPPAITISQKGWMAAAATVLIIITATWLWKESNNTVTPIASVSTTAPQDSAQQIELLLSSGKKVSFTNQPQTINVDDVKINASGDVLQYQDETEKAVEYNTLRIPEKAEYQIVLSDGSKIWLNSCSSLKFPFNFPDSTREVYIEGEAYFEVTKNAKKPFIIHTPKTTVEVLGTAFNINTYDKEIVKTSVVEGSVTTKANNGAKVLLFPGLEAYYNDNIQTFKTTSFDQQMVLAWMHGVYYFNKVQLNDLKGPLERWFGVKVNLNKNSLEKTTVSGIIEKGKLLDFLENLKATTGINYSLQNNILVFTN